MKISIFTPSHNTKYLPFVYESILNQSYTDWEWIIVLNGWGATAFLPEKLMSDERVRIYRLIEDGNRNIGYLKHLACSYCTGDYLLELDHDDSLNPSTCYQIAKLGKEESPDFIYSDFIEFREDGSSRVYGEQYEWKHYSTIVNGKNYLVNKAQPINPRTLYQIMSAPNHVRVWKKSFYDHIGGHDVTLKVCDDHDLVCRTYLMGGKIAYINEPLYLYRLHDKGTNTYLELNDEIQVTQQIIGNKYFYKIVEKWAKDSNLPMIDLGGAHNSPEGYESLDKVDPADYVYDVKDGLPFEDNSIGVIRAYDFFEHMERGVGKGSMVQLMNEIHRVLVPGGWILSATPSTDGRGAYQDPTHINFMNQNSFWYYTDRTFSKYVPEITARFQPTRIWTDFPSQWHKENDIPYVYADLLCLKDQDVYGGIAI